MKDNRNILAIECAVADGSVALIRGDGDEVVTREGSGCSRAEKIISIIDGVVNEAGLALPDIDLIAVSTGPGSYSGIRIGMSTALGLANALSVPCVGVSVLDAMASAAEISEPIVAAIPVGKNDVAWQAYEIKHDGHRSAAGEAHLSSPARLVAELERLRGSVLFAQTDLIYRLTERQHVVPRHVDAGTGLARFVGRFASSRKQDGSSLRPIYLRNADATGRPAAF